MPEGPSLVILREEAARFEGQEIVSAEGNTSALDPARLRGQPILSLRTFGKQFIIALPDMAISDGPSAAVSFASAARNAIRARESFNIAKRVCCVSRKAFNIDCC